MEPVKIEELKDQTEQNISTAEESASEAPSEEKKERLSFENRKLEALGQTLRPGDYGFQSD